MTSMCGTKTLLQVQITSFIWNTARVRIELKPVKESLDFEWEVRSSSNSVVIPSRDCRRRLIPIYKLVLGCYDFFVQEYKFTKDFIRVYSAGVQIPTQR